MGGFRTGRRLRVFGDTRSLRRATSPPPRSLLGRPFPPKAVLLSLFCSFAALEARLGAAELNLNVVERGEDYAVYGGPLVGNTATGADQFLNAGYTVIENGLHYLNNGEWTPSRDLIESSSEGCVARHGPHPASFAHDLHVPGAFDILIADGQHLSGGVRTIQLTDLA